MIWRRAVNTISAAAFLAIPFLAACSSSRTISTTSTVTGSVGGAPFTPASAIAGFSSENGLYWIGISSTLANACDPACIEDNAIEISVPTGQATPGTMTIGSQETSVSAYVNSSCPAGGAITVFTSVSGTVTFDTITSTGASGSFDITFTPQTGGGSGGELVGTFDSVACPAE